MQANGNEDRMLTYFGYGTLLGEGHMKHQYPSARSLGMGFCKGYELGFWCYADPSDGGCAIVEKPDGILFGMLYELSQEDMDRLLVVGGHADWYQALPVDVTSVAGGSVRALTLRVAGFRGGWAPPPDYAALVIDGAREAGLPAEYQQRLADIVDRARAGS